MTIEYGEPFKIFKPRKDISGCASQWSLASKKNAVFLEFAHQKKSSGPNSAFDWEKKISMKLDIADIGEILSALDGDKSGVGPLSGSERKGLFHKNKNGNTILRLQRGNESENWYIKISSKSSNGEVRAMQHAITLGEAKIICCLLRGAVGIIHGW